MNLMDPTEPMEPNSSSSLDPTSSLPTREELEAELLPVPEPPEAILPPQPPGTDRIIAEALTYIRGKRGADLVSIILVGSGARRSLTLHSDLNFIALVKGQDEGEEIVRVADRLIDVRYRSHKAVEQEMPHASRLPPLLRKGRVLFDHDMIGAKLVEKAAQRFRQGPKPASMNERIRLKADCLHRLGKAQDMLHQPATAQYLLGVFLDHLLNAFFRLRGFWLTAPADLLRFTMTRDAAVGELFDRAMTAPTLAERLALGQELSQLIFKDIPNPARVD
ncbi:hypothetical protein [Nitrospira sp. Nam74]